MGISDFGQVGRLISKRFQEGLSLLKIEGADFKVVIGPLLLMDFKSGNWY